MCECEFHRVTFTDDSTIMIGGVSFVMTAFSVDRALDRTGAVCLSRLLTHVKSLQIYFYISYPKILQMLWSNVVIKCTNLSTLTLHGFPVQEVDLRKLISDSPNLTSFSIRKCLDGDADALVTYLAVHCKQITEIVLDNPFSDTILKELLDTCILLQELCLPDRCWNESTVQSREYRINRM